MHKAAIKRSYNPNKTINKVKSEKVVLRFTDIADIDKAKIVAYSDASFNNLPEGKSQGGYCFSCWRAKMLYHSQGDQGKLNE